MMQVRRVVADLRAGRQPATDDLRVFAQGLASGAVTDAQAGAFAMGVCLGGLGDAGRVALTEAMRDSGDVLAWDMPGPVLDKHSTGGLGDCVSLVLAPALAACGAYVPMISGRGLGHTGGTLDKLEAIPGFNVDASEAQLRRIVSDVGCAIVSASGQIAPADKRLYAIRDISGTVDSIDLITASILSKKLAAGLHSLVLDVKWGSGAFMQTIDDARALAQSLVDTANAAGCRTSALITDMNQPLVRSLGNALEVAEVMLELTGAARGPLFELTCALGAEVLVLSGLAATVAEGSDKIAMAINSGAAAEQFDRMVAAQGGPKDFSAEWAALMPEAPVIREIYAERPGFVAALDGRALGMAVVGLGGGRSVETDKVNPAVGLSDMVRLGHEVQRGSVLARVHARSEADADKAEAAVRAAINLDDHAPKAWPLIVERVGP